MVLTTPLLALIFRAPVPVDLPLFESSVMGLDSMDEGWDVSTFSRASEFC